MDKKTLPISGSIEITQAHPASLPHDRCSRQTLPSQKVRFFRDHYGNAVIRKPKLKASGNHSLSVTASKTPGRTAQSAAREAIDDSRSSTARKRLLPLYFPLPERPTMFFSCNRVASCGVLVSLIAVGWGGNVVAQDFYNNYSDAVRGQQCPNCNHELPGIDLPGFRGQPYRDTLAGGCRCGHKSELTYYNAYWHWPSPFSVLLDHGRYGDQYRSTADTTCPRLRDCLEPLAQVRLAPPVRTDNGYAGPHCDPYGYLGVSRQARSSQPVQAPPLPGPSHRQPAPDVAPPTQAPEYLPGFDFSYHHRQPRPALTSSDFRTSLDSDIQQPVPAGTSRVPSRAASSEPFGLSVLKLR